MFVDPATPLVKVVRPALLGDTLECSDTNAVVEWDGDGTLLPRLGMGVVQNCVVTAGPMYQ
jgi:hypothetical protein